MRNKLKLVLSMCAISMAIRRVVMHNRGIDLLSRNTFVVPAGVLCDWQEGEEAESLKEGEDVGEGEGDDDREVETRQAEGGEDDGEKVTV